eukprot:362824-Chlamydomonas_euryale.AAC.11
MCAVLLSGSHTAAHTERSGSVRKPHKYSPFGQKRAESGRGPDGVPSRMLASRKNCTRDEGQAGKS